MTGRVLSSPCHPGRAPGTEFPEIWVTALGLCSLAGDRPFALLAAVGTHLSGARPRPELLLPVAEGSEAPAVTAPIPAFETIEPANERILLLAANALKGALESTSEAVTGDRILVLLCLPGAATARGGLLREETPAESLKAVDLRLKEAVLRTCRPEEGGAERLREACRELAEGRWDAVLFGGADSLVDLVSAGELMAQGRLANPGGEGVIPGEGAGFLLLQRPGEEPPLARLRGVSHAPEPHSGEADCRPMRGMVEAVEDACAQAGIAPSTLGAIVQPLGAEREGELEWYQVGRRLWPPRRPGQDAAPPPSDPEVLRPFLCLGETGAASFVLGLVLGCSRFEFDHPPLKHLLVCEGGEAPLRGAVILESPEAKNS